MERIHGRLAAVAIGAALLFAALGGAALAAVATKPDKTKGAQTSTSTTTSTQTETSATPKKVTICHKGKVTLSVSASAVTAHQQQHRDTLGACPTGPASATKNGKADKAPKENKSS